MFGLMLCVFLVLSGFSFIESRNQVTPDQVTFAQQFTALDGKRIFQAYNCMDCHTIVGNGGYFAPDLTKEYNAAGPAWLMAFLPSAGGWPTEGALKVQLASEKVQAELAQDGITTLEEYYEKYPGAKARIDRRGGKNTYMPNLKFRPGETEKLMAFLKYTSEMNNEGWPPAVKTGSLERRLQLAHGSTASAAPAPAAASAAAAPAENNDPVARGKAVAEEMGCIACHSVEPGKTLVGPSWARLYNSQVKLADGRIVTANDGYLEEHIQHPENLTVDGFVKGTMPSYDGLINTEQLHDLVAYIRSLEK